MDTEVLVVGAGPTGLTLACDLLRRGLGVRIVDSSPVPFAGSRGKGLQPRTLEVFDDLGIIEEVLQAGCPFPKFRTYTGLEISGERSLGEMIALPYSAADLAGTPYPSPWLIPQWRTDEILNRRLESLGGRVERSAELLDFEQDSEGVLARVGAEPIRARYLVGADGAHSRVRKQMRVGFLGETYESERTLLADVRLRRPLEPGFCHVFTAGGDIQSRVSLWSLPHTDVHQFVATLPTESTPTALDPANLQQIFSQRAGRDDVIIREVVWSSIYRVNVRMVERFRQQRVFLCGDAAHIHSSAGGQGLNSGVQDAYNLGWKLAAALAGDPSRLDSYESERLPIAADLLQVTSRLHRQDFRPGAGAADLYQLHLNYRRGCQLPGLQVGDRAPDAVGSGGRLFDFFRGPHHTLLQFGDGATPVVPPATILVPIRDASIARLYGVETGTVLVRPDGYIGWIER